MAALFSTVTLTAKSERLSFLVSGFPSDVCFLRGIPVFEDFMFRTVGQDVDIYIIAFLYGDGDIAYATLEEAAYFAMKINEDEKFLVDRCKHFCHTRINVKILPDEFYNLIKSMRKEKSE